MPDKAGAVPAARARILAAARDLFHRHGLRGVGVDTIAQAAGTNKMTLYRHFESKNELIVAYLRSVAAEGEAMWLTIERDNPDDAKAQLKAWLKLAEECVAVDGRGCSLADAAAELSEAADPARRIVDDMKSEQRERLAGLCRRAGAAQAGVLADTLMLLLDGARINRQEGVAGAGTQFTAIASAVIDTFIVHRPSDRKIDLRKRA